MPILPVSKDLTNKPYKLVLYALLGVTLLIIYGVIGSTYIMRLDLVNSIYFTVQTIATVGFGDIRPITPLQKMFTVTLVMGGVALLAYAFTLTITVVTMAVEEIASGAKQRRIIAASKDHFVLCGYGRVGSAVYKELKKRNIRSIIIEKNKDVVEKELWKDPDVLAIPGDATDESIMMDAGIKRARGVIITTGDDVDNLFITLTAREIHPEIWIVTRASKSENVRRLYRSGADKVISPETSGAEDIYFASMEPTIMKITEIHGVEDIRKESEIILKYGCTLENIEYHLPEFKEPLARKIGVTDIEQLNRFLSSLEREKSRKKSLESIYESVSGIHSHWISGPTKESLEKVAEELKKEGFLLGVNLTEDEIKETAKKHGRMVEVVLKPEIKITENHDIQDIREEAKIILKHGCTLEDIEYYLPGFKEPLKRKIGLSDEKEMDRFLSSLEHDSKRMDALERLYILSGGGIHSHTISGKDTQSLAKVEKELKTEGFLLGVNLTHGEIVQKISEFGRVSELLLRHKPSDTNDKRIIISMGGRILDSKHYLPGLRQVVTRKLYLKDENDLKNCEEEYKKPDAKRSLEALSQISRQVHSHTVSAGDIEKIKKIEKALKKTGMLLGVDLPEDDIWNIVESEEIEKFCIQ
ncbi:NAD-binding protein [Methanobacterium sp. VT]|uniref:NAD-binding protein n=2 Tax=Methanobacterium spitsbergense TaxID=2874285 RepID=A0A8T5US06_9EURY|nr:3H domain-containing protein [Methanobacterium spitsbergense]MBZ2164907.1 NAD-binding protein [Methanobacterium spitsbergense]